MMHGHDESRKGSGIRLSNILASVHEVSSDIAMGLENFAQSLNARRRAAGAE